MNFGHVLKIFILAVCNLSVIAGTAFAEEEVPKELQGVTIREHLGGTISPDLKFTDHNGKAVTIGSFFADGKPTILTLNYYKCKMLCTLQLNALSEGLKNLSWKAGDKFRIVTVSIDPRNTWQMARDKREQYVNLVGKGDIDWSFLVGTQNNIQTLASQVGFEYKYDREEDQYAHGLAIYFIGSGGLISRYLYGLKYPEWDLKLALVDTANGKLGSPVEKFIMSCFHYDENRGKYGPTIFGIMRAGGALTVTLIGAGLGIFWRREKRVSREGSKSCLIG